MQLAIDFEKPSFPGPDLTHADQARLGKALTHGQRSYGRKSKVYRAWQHMKSRCSNPNNEHFADYGGRGITFCERWKTFENFYADMGDPPSLHHQIDRIDNEGNYEPGNCRWATRSQNCRNRRVRSSSQSGLKGVSKDRRRWRAYINTRNIGSFDTPEAAARAYDAAAREEYGEYASLNYPEATP